MSNVISFHYLGLDAKIQKKTSRKKVTTGGRNEEREIMPLKETITIVNCITSCREHQI